MSAQPSLVLRTPPHHIMNMNMMGIYHKLFVYSQVLHSSFLLLVEAVQKKYV